LQTLAISYKMSINMKKWLSIVGVGEDGLAGINPAGSALLAQAEIVVGGERHLAMLPIEDRRQKIPWSTPIQDSIAQILQLQGLKVCVLASGDPMCYGIGATLTRLIPIAQMTIIPAPSAFSLACGRLGWSCTEVETLSLCGRDPDLLRAVLYPGAKILILSADKTTPRTVANLLVQTGWGASNIQVLERLGGSRERRIEGMATEEWEERNLADLNTIAVTCIPAVSTPHRSLHSPGLPDTAYHHDGQLTKREVRAVTLSTLAPLPGELLWDVGAGCGSISIEWMRSHPRCRAIAIEQHPQRLQYIADNAAALGVPHLQIVSGSAPIAIEGLPSPDAIFIGGGLTIPHVFDTCWRSLKIGGRLVVNAVTVETEQQLLQYHHELGGELTRISIQRATPVGKFLGWKAMATVTQWLVVKNRSIVDS
jgi:precorrin-6B C5,15-methyltransferase / cobalt-precorrin-6B C5,C15-methyltransferase